jgi:hypothetical protein
MVMLAARLETPSRGSRALGVFAETTLSTLVMLAAMLDQIKLLPKALARLAFGNHALLRREPRF